MALHQEFGIGQVETFPLPVDEESLFRLLKDLFETHWDQILFGLMIQGAVFEARSEQPPRSVSLFDGYLTVDFGRWHLHICIGDHQGSPRSPTPPDVAFFRRCSRAEFYRFLNHDGAPRSWGLRLFNGGDQQQLTVFFPNPFLTNDMTVTQRADWTRLALWDDMRARYLGLSPDPLDRTGTHFQCGEH